MSREFIIQLEATIKNLRRDNALLKEQTAKYKDLEEELGCSLEVIVRAVKYGIYIKNIDGEMVNFKCELYYKNLELGWYFLIINGYVPLTDYKTKFWLKEDKSE